MVPVGFPYNRLFILRPEWGVLWQVGVAHNYVFNEILTRLNIDGLV